MLHLSIQSGRDIPTHSNLLGIIQYGDSPAEVAATELPQLSVTSKCWGQSSPSLIISSDAPVSYWTASGLQYAFDGQTLFATVVFPEAAIQSTGGDVHALEKIVYRAYTQIFELMRLLGVGHLWRTWNYLSDINDDADGMERYRQFNIGRHQAFGENLSIAHRGMPAACALGTAPPGLLCAILAGHAGFEQIENPRQKSAYEYPVQYGPRSPTFSRAILVPKEAGNHLLVSGTASIVGHTSVHLGDVAAQTLEAVNNLRTIVSEANGRQPHAQFVLQNLDFVVYVRHAHDFAIVEPILAAQIKGPDNSIAYLQADICRKELLVEIEAFC